MSNSILDGKKEWDKIRDQQLPVCRSCTRWKTGTRTCLAFAVEIPRDIFILGNPHTKPFPGDNGIQFETIEEEQT